MADDNHGQMQLLQQQQTPSQQPQMQQSQLQQNQMQQNQLQQSQLQQSQLQQSQLQQSQMQQNQMQQSQMQQSQLQQNQQQQNQLQQLQQNQLQQSQLQQSQLQQNQLHQSQLQQSQMQQPQLQQTQLQQSQLQQSQVPQQHTSVEHSSLSVSSTSVPLSVVSVSQAQMQQGSTSVQMSQLPSMMSQSSVSHPTMMHPTMTMAQAPLQQVQVIGQPGSYLQHLYNPQMLFPAGTPLTLQQQPTLQQAAGQLSLQLQPKPIDPKTSAAQAMVAANKGQAMTVNAGTMMTASGQVLPKPGFPQQMQLQPGKSAIIHGTQSTGFGPAGHANQTVVIGQLMPNQQSIFNHKAIADASQKGKFVGTFQGGTALQPKTLQYSQVPASSAQVFNGLKQMSSQPQMITTQAQPGAMFTQAHQLLGLQTLPPGLSWAPGSFQSANLLGQTTPIFIRSQQSDMFIQQSPAIHMQQTQQPFTPSPIAPSSQQQQQMKQQKQVRMRPGTHSVAVGTQTQVSNSTTMHSNTTPIRTQIKPKGGRLAAGPSPGPTPTPPQMVATQTQTQQHQTTQLLPPQQPPLQQSSPVVQQPPAAAATLQVKSDAGNQTYSRVQPTATTPQPLPPNLKPSEPPKPVPPPKSQALVAPSTKVMQAQTETPVPIATAPTQPMPAAPVPMATVATAAVDATPAVPPQPVEVPPVEVVAGPQGGGGGALRPQQPIGQPALKDKQPPQKAIVKPQVLTHVIDGLVIQEGPEPFPVSRSALLDSPGRMMASEKAELKRKDSTSVSGSPDKKLKGSHRGNVELAKCEHCGKLGPKSKFKRSKRFCSNSCAKSSSAGGPGRKKRGGRKGSYIKEAEVEEEDEDEEEESSPVEEDTSSTPMEEEAATLQPAQEVKQESEDQKEVAKWTVQEVFDFIRGLDWCKDEVAEKFRQQEIDGQALLLLNTDHLFSSMGMFLGPALKLLSHIDTLKRGQNAMEQ